jgi:hypothetical protein
MQAASYPSSTHKNLGLTVQGTVPDQATPVGVITYFDVLVLEPSELRKKRVLIIQLTPEKETLSSYMNVNAEYLQAICEGYALLQDTQDVYYFDLRGNFGAQFSAQKLYCQEEWEWAGDADTLPLKALASAVTVPTYGLAEMLKVFG